MVQVYTLHIDRNLTGKEIHKLMKYISPNMKQRTKDFIM